MITAPAPATVRCALRHLAPCTGTATPTGDRANHCGPGMIPGRWVRGTWDRPRCE
jgi:hypothetical protein